MINQKEIKQVRMDSWLLKVLSRDMKTNRKNKGQPTNNYKNNGKIKAMENISLGHYPRNG